MACKSCLVCLDTKRGRPVTVNIPPPRIAAENKKLAD